MVLPNKRRSLNTFVIFYSTIKERAGNNDLVFVNKTQNMRLKFIKFIKEKHY